MIVKRLVGILLVGGSLGMAAPFFDRICGKVACREESEIVLAVDDKNYFTNEVVKSPYVHNNLVTIFPGEKLFIEGEIDGKEVANLKYVKEVVDPGSTITIEFSQPNAEQRDPMMLMSINNPFKETYSYRLIMLPTEPARFVHTSSCTVSPGRVAYESWPHPIQMLALGNFTILGEGDGDERCKKW